MISNNYDSEGWAIPEYDESLESPIDGLGEEERELREARHVRELRAIRDELLAIAELINGKIDRKFADYVGPHASIHVPLSAQEIEALRAAIAKAKNI